MKLIIRDKPQHQTATANRLQELKAEFRKQVFEEYRKAAIQRLRTDEPSINILCTSLDAEDEPGNVTSVQFGGAPVSISIRAGMTRDEARSEIMKVGAYLLDCWDAIQLDTAEWEREQLMGGL